MNVNRLKPYIRRSAALTDNNEVTFNCGEDEVNIEGRVLLTVQEEKYDVVTDKRRKRKADKCDQPPPKKHYNRVTRLDQLVQEILCGNEFTDEPMAVASELLKKNVSLFWWHAISFDGTN